MRTQSLDKGLWHLAAALILSLVVIATSPMASADAEIGSSKYPQVSPAIEYLMTDRAAEIALARSAAPDSISGSATVLVLSPKGYSTVIDGTNGFTCLVERGWMSPFDNPEFWNPKIRGPVCYNPIATRSILPITRLRTKLALAGESKRQMIDDIQLAVTRKELPTLEPGAMSYMMSKNGYLGDDAGAWHSHLMFYVPGTDVAVWGANLKGSPVVADDEHLMIPEQEIIFFVPVTHWSDGSLAPAGAHAMEGMNH